MWFDKSDPRVTFLDIRDCEYVIAPDLAYPKGTVVAIRPDVVGDFAEMPFPDESFHHVVFDPPHVKRNEPLGTVTKKYGVLGECWREMLRGGFAECFRVLKPGGTLVFKWCEVEIPVQEVLSLTDQQPLYGHRSGKKAGTHWIVFIKPVLRPTWMGDAK